jgi:hypothetical protein
MAKCGGGVEAERASGLASVGDAAGRSTAVIASARQPRPKDDGVIQQEQLQLQKQEQEQLQLQLQLRGSFTSFRMTA